MTIGDGLFWGACIFSLVILYAVTKDRWKWKRIVIGVFALIALGIGAFIADDNWWRLEQLLPTKPLKPPESQTRMWGLFLGQKKSDVLILKGKPISSDGYDVYKSRDVTYLIHYDKSELISWIADSGDRLNMPNIDWITPYTDYDDVIAVLGKPASIDTSSDGLQRITCWQQSHICIVIEKGETKGMAIYSKNPPEFSKEAKSK